MGIPIATVTSEGTRLDPTTELLSLEVRRELNRIPEARLTLLDGSVASRRFALSNTALFEPGKRVTIALRYENEGSDTKVFDGLVVRHAVETQARGSVLRVDLKDPAFRLTRQRKSAVFRQRADDEAIRTLLKAARLEAGTIAVTKSKHEELVQYYASDWDFILSRADVQGLVVDVDRGKVSVQTMVPSKSEAIRLEYGLGTLLDFDLEIDGTSQWAAMTSAGWDVQKLDTTAPVAAKPPKLSAGNVDPAAVAKKLGGDTYALLHPGIPAPAELQAWADSRLARSRLAFLRGRLRLPGRTDIAPLHLVELGGIGDRFNGTALVSGVTQLVEHGGWVTELRLGLPPDWFARRPEIHDVPAAGLLPPVLGLQIGIVDKFEKDPLGELRIKVRLSAFEKKQGAVWARMARPDAGKQRGFVWWPEPGDEVVVGFVCGDPRQAIVLGALHGSANQPPTAAGPPSAENDQRAIVSKGGTVIAFDDAKKIVRIETPGRCSVILDDDAKAIRLADPNGNKITMDSKGISLTSGKDFTIEASGEVVIKGSKVSVQ